MKSKDPPAVRPHSIPESLFSLWELFESCWSLKEASRPSIEDVMAFHGQWHANMLDLDIPIKVTVTESRPRASGGYSDVYIGRFYDMIVRLHNASLRDTKLIPTLGRCEGH
jgi:hypothetical protein